MNSQIISYYEGHFNTEVDFTKLTPPLSIENKIIYNYLIPRYNILLRLNRKTNDFIARSALNATEKEIKQTISLFLFINLFDFEDISFYKSAVNNSSKFYDISALSRNFNIESSEILSFFVNNFQVTIISSGTILIKAIKGTASLNNRDITALLSELQILCEPFYSDKSYRLKDTQKSINYLIKSFIN